MGVCGGGLLALSVLRSRLSFFTGVYSFNSSTKSIFILPSSLKKTSPKVSDAWAHSVSCL